MKLKFRVLAIAGVVIFGLTGCSGQNSYSDETLAAVVPTPEATQVTADEDVIAAPLPQAPVGLPASWSSSEVSLWNTLASVSPTIAGINNSGKSALMENAHLTCQAYSEGYGRLEILNATNGPSLPSGLADDMMTLAVTSFCPQYSSLQLR
jgi:hypothetical protein